MIAAAAPDSAGGAWSVAALLAALGRALDEHFAACTVQGEISGFTRAASGHCYFTLKDSDGAAAALRCVMFRRAAVLVDFAPRDGARVELRGRVALYEPRGELQFVVESMRAQGAGALYEQFLRLKAKLEAEGLFEAARKRELPRLPRSVGIVTSLAGAALHDMLTSLARRAPQVRVVVYPALVQGAQAPASIVAALAAAAQRREAELLIVARGGGSLEDLWAFNDESVVRAIAALPMPCISGVGHETDVTLADFAADLRAATPTAAAELCTPSRDELQAACAALARRLLHAGQVLMQRRAQQLDRLAWSLGRPAERVARAHDRLRALAQRARHAMARDLERRTTALVRRQEAFVRLPREALARRAQRLDLLAARLAALDPTRVLGRGYALVQDSALGTLIRAPAQIGAGQALTLTLAEGVARLRVASTERE